MLLRVIVDPPDEFEKWLKHQKEDADKPPADDSRAREGQAVFLKQSCVNCHRVRGTSRTRERTRRT